MLEVLNGLKFVQVSLDDIIVYIRDFLEHIHHLEHVFERLLKAELKSLQK